MWEVIAIIVIAILLVLTAPKPKIENARAAKFGDFQFPRSREGDPVPWFRGTVRLQSPNTTWAGDYLPVPIVKKQKTGLFSSKKVTVGFKYNIGLDLEWALGPGVKLLRLWAGKYDLWQGSVSTETSITINQPNLFGGPDTGHGGMQGIIDFYPGNFTQSRNSYLADKADPEVPAYVGQCHMVFRGLTDLTGSIWGNVVSTPNPAGGFYFGTSTSLESISAEMQCLTTYIHPTYSIMPNGKDTNPMELLYSAMYEKWGMLGTDSNDIDMPSWQACAQTLYNENLGMSLLLQQSVTGKDVAEEVLRIADGILYEDPTSGKIVAKLIRFDYDPATLPVFDQSVIKELVSFSKSTWEGTFNQCRVTFKDRDNSYADKVATAQDFANINYQSRIRNLDISIPGCFDNTEGNLLAARQLSYYSVPLFTIEIRCNRKAALTKPGDVFVFNWAPYGISNMVMRVQKVDLGTLTDGTITINAIQDRFANSTAVFAPPGGTGWTDGVVPPVALARQGLFELPYEMNPESGSVVSTFGSSNAAYDRGYNIYGGVASGDANLYFLTQTADFTPSAVLAGAYPATTPDRDPTGFTVNTLLHGLAIDSSVTEAELLSGASIALIRSSAGDELVAFKAFSGTIVSDVIRGIFGTVPLSHPAGATVYFVTSGFGLLNEDEAYPAAQTVYSKLLPYNEKGTLPIASATQMTMTTVQKASRPAVPGKVQINGGRAVDATSVTGPFTLSWAHRTRFDTQVRIQSEGSMSPETNTYYNVRIYNNSTNALLAQQTNANATSASIQSTLAGTLRIELEAVIAGLVSYSKHVFTVTNDPTGSTGNTVTADTATYILDGGGA